ncbi:MAG: MptD family putative ECF transporter S component [Treponema sp.]|nr:MptD family putative ECF transporter S component [Treponema sp.]
MDESKKLKGKDLVNIGIFAAIYFIVMFAIACLGFMPIFMPLLYVLVPLFGGIPYMLFLTKVRKFGMISIFSTICGILSFVTGMNVIPIFLSIVVGLLADFLCKSGDYKSVKKSIFSCGIFSIWIIGYCAPLYINPEQYWTNRSSYGAEYAQAVMQFFPIWSLPIYIVSCFLFGCLGAILGRLMLKKHFEKAGIA